MRIRLLLMMCFITAVYALLLIPDTPSNSVNPALSKPFGWNRDERWQQLQLKFESVRQLPKCQLDSIWRTHQVNLELSHRLIQQADSASVAALFQEWQDAFFDAAPVVAAIGKTTWYTEHYNAIRALVKDYTRKMDITETPARAWVYTMLYGMRATVEEVLLQADTVNFNPVQLVHNEPSSTPHILLQGIRVHSGDLLVSRGGAEVSAFISRGNDYSGNFSHVALLHVSEDGKASFIEAHIEKGVAVATVDEYLRDKKLRLMVLRPRADLPQLVSNPMLPHLAAQTALIESKNRHIPYDFKMNFYDSSAMFCSEVGSYAYRKNGIRLWQAPSTISSTGMANWLSAFGVENFLTQMPSDLEYDPQLALVAEWYNPDMLLNDHLDNAVMDALYERADQGMEIPYNFWLLPVARVIKAYSWVQNALGYPGKIPEGMSATQALKNIAFVELYRKTRASTHEKINRFIAEKTYRPPYWEMVTLARQSVPN